ncbi:MAG TPA: zinc-dependent metalloprotease family protein [Enhygromyxa sp.]|nr:zinc-dependent metalloprotease family protein [Enhygromyxa sp.]
MTTQLRLHAIPLSDSDGGRAYAFTSADLEATVTRVNQYFATADIELLFDPTTDWEPREDTFLNDMDRGNSSWPSRPNRVAEQYPGKIVVFFRWGTGTNATGNGNAYPPDIGEPIPSSWANEPRNVHFVTMPSTKRLIDQNDSFFAHELGHYLGLYHTFPFTSSGPVIALAQGETLTADEAEERLVRFIRKNGGTLAALNGDLISDTEPDPGSAFWRFHGHTSGGPTSVTITGTLDGVPYNFTLTPPLDNIMSYYGGLGFTPAQRDRMHRTLRHPSRSHLLRRRWPDVTAAGGFLLLMA